MKASLDNLGMDIFHLLINLFAGFFGIALVWTSFFLYRRFQKPKSILSILSLTTGTFLFLAGSGDFFLSLYFEIKPDNRRFPKAPFILSSYQGLSYHLVQDSILYILPPNRNGATIRTFGNKFSTNSLGFREKEFSFNKNPDTFRILIFGDSLTFGTGINGNIRYSNILSHLLNANRNSKTRFEVLNFGMPGYALDQEHDLIQAILKVVECDLVILGFFWNDLGETSLNYLKNITDQHLGIHYVSPITNTEIFKNPTRNLSTLRADPPLDSDQPNLWFTRSSIYKFLETRTNINEKKKLPSNTEWKYAEKEFLGILRLTRQHQMPPPVAALLLNGFVDPKKNEFIKPYGELAQYIYLNQFVKKKLGKMGFPVVDTLPLFKKYNGMSMALSEWESHPNYLGHYIYAQSIYDFIKELSTVKRHL